MPQLDESAMKGDRRFPYAAEAGERGQFVDLQMKGFSPRKR
jgi:hypothetical protein